MRQTYVCGLAIAAALGFAPPANAGMVNAPTIRPSPKHSSAIVTNPKVVNPQVMRKAGGKPLSQAPGGTRLNFGQSQFRHVPQGPGSNQGSANIGTGYDIGANKSGGTGSNQGHANVGVGYGIGANKPGH